MPRSSPGPLTDADYSKINSALQGLENTQMEIGQAMQAGLDCQQEDQLCKDLQRRLHQIKATYFPNHP